MSTIPTEALQAVVELTVQAGDAAEIVVLDSRGRLVERGFGPVASFKLAPSIYRVKVTEGSESQEKRVILDVTRSLKFDPVKFDSPVPIWGTSTTHEYHVAAAVDESRKVHAVLGHGSTIFVFVRDWTPDGSSMRGRIDVHPMDGMSLMTGGSLASKVDLRSASSGNPSGDPWAACCIEVDPGVHELCLQLPDGRLLHQTVVTCPGWQTQVFMFMRPCTPVSNESAKARWRADFAQASILMSRHGFEPSDRETRAADLARIELASPRPPGSQRGRQQFMPVLLGGKFDNPMLGILAGHLLLRDASPDMDLLRTVVGNLRGLLSSPHPDVEVLAEAVGQESSTDGPPQVPMLHASWLRMIDASFIQTRSEAREIARLKERQMRPSGAWLVWEEVPAGEPLSDIDYALIERLGIGKLARKVQRMADDIPVTVRDRESVFMSGMGSLVKQGMRAAAAGEASISGFGTQEIQPAAFPASLDPRLSDYAQSLRNVLGEKTELKVAVDVDAKVLRSAARSLGLTQSQLAATLSALEAKLGSIDALPSVKINVVGDDFKKREAT